MTPLPPNGGCLKASLPKQSAPAAPDPFLPSSWESQIKSKIKINNLKYAQLDGARTASAIIGYPGAKKCEINSQEIV
ncbi:hypothetical protein AVEN_226727-1 [Araneus ventricosus]|uniref:Uncharacterized protein n=1 Tax=Araneus ventricosus TaxID=182803 RepID=A0A4Y2VMU9_ARAVE|nr:hypothetical protein AVEN_226727-1 [Araneus ventricosus]